MGSCETGRSGYHLTSAYRSPYEFPDNKKKEKCHAATPAGKMSRSRSTASTCGKNFCDDHRLPPNHACAGLAEWKKTPAPGVGIRYGPGGATPYGGGYAAVPPGKKPGRRPGRRIPYLKIAVAVIVIILIVTFLPWPERASAPRVKRTGPGTSRFRRPNLQRRSGANLLSGMPAAHSRTFRDGKTLAGELLAAMHRAGMLGVTYPDNYHEGVDREVRKGWRPLPPHSFDPW